MCTPDSHSRATRAKILAGGHPCGRGKVTLDRYTQRNGNFVLVRSQEPEAESQNLRVELKAAGERKHCADPFCLLTSGFHIPLLFAGYQGRSPWLVQCGDFNRFFFEVFEVFESSEGSYGYVFYILQRG
jgi:hypothetical protein